MIYRLSAHTFRPLLAGLLLAGLFFITGCSGKNPLGKVQGEVSYRGQVVPAAEVHFYSKERGVGAIARVEGEGKFSLDTPLPVGTYSVYVTPPMLEPGDPAQTPAASVPTVQIPAKYRDMNTSGLSFEVKKGENDFPIELID